MNELRLIKQIRRNGDRAAADRLVRHYYDDMYRFVRRQVSSDDIALDLTQEIFISMLRSIGHYDARGGASFRTWLHRIAANKLIDWYRSRAYRNGAATITLDETEPVDESDFTRLLESGELVEQVFAFVGEMPPDTQKIFRLHLFGGYTFREIAGITDLAEGSVKSRYYRLIQRLGKEFADYE
ncbi:RNA polymerase sigma factor [Saccharibacillus sp. CPCC 101409]|uniref:RNA polymerase sigma factor n=1 Tax=Saccharibacillus sp. CPCC 101409 TaxID=3058041 RepID=UPI002671EF16|nr:RNA polymerase sigma factor [Saccharibacillus sp. CPCC 101409]MDO3413313.1 RNA polymerase sigma factor [Saccharibacillus sp. CPCC 101409]